MLKQDKRSRLGVGLYSVPDAARIIKSSIGCVRRWINSSHGVVNGSFDPQEHTITFLELMELHFIKLFRDEGVGLDSIRKAAKTAARQFGTCYPFAVHRFDTDGRTVFATLLSGEKESAVIEDLKHGQYVFDTIVRPFFKKLEYGPDTAVRFWPLGIKERVVLESRASIRQTDRQRDGRAHHSPVPRD